jgi:plastocyanin
MTLSRRAVQAAATSLVLTSLLAACGESSVPTGPPASAPTPVPGTSATTGDVVLTARNIAFEPTELSAPAGQPFTFEFVNQDAALPHNVEIKGADGSSVFRGEVFTGPASRVYEIPALVAGGYAVSCTVHPNMVAKLTAGS